MKTFVAIVEMPGYNPDDVAEQFVSLKKKGRYSVRFCIRCGESESQEGLHYWKVGVELNARSEYSMTTKLIAIDGIDPSSIEWYSEVLAK